MVIARFESDQDKHRQLIRQHYLIDETELVQTLLPQAILTASDKKCIETAAKQLIIGTREASSKRGGIDALLREYDLSSAEGVSLMCLAEALLRVPDANTADRLIKDKLSGPNWEKHLGKSDSLFVNASTWGLLLTGKLIRYERSDMHGLLNRLLTRGSDPIIRLAIQHAMGIIGQQFILAETIEKAIQISVQDADSSLRYSFDMLGEAALTHSDAEIYFSRYADAISHLAVSESGKNDFYQRANISLKLSAIHPRFEFNQRQRVMNELVPKVLRLAKQAAAAGISMTIDAEESDRLELTLDVFTAIYSHPQLDDWPGLGLAVQAYQKRAIPVIKWLQSLAQTHKKQFMLRLVKGAYWDSEIKLAQEQGLDSYPVFTRKELTDLSYLACARQILSDCKYIYPQFATHNAYTLAAIETLVPAKINYEFQRLHGMGEAVYHLAQKEYPTLNCRVYAPVGSHVDLLPYLIRRLLENGANTSFIKRIENNTLPVDALIQDVAEQIPAFDSIPNPDIPLPKDIFKPERNNSRSLNLYDIDILKRIEQAIYDVKHKDYTSALLSNNPLNGASKTIYAPYNPKLKLGNITQATCDDVELAFSNANVQQVDWSGLDIKQRCRIAERAAELIEQQLEELIALCVLEGGRTIKDSLGEVREAIDACRYYAVQAHQSLTSKNLSGITGETNRLSMHGRGVIVCLSPWNFPIAIFTAQIVAALIAGNCVLAKPAQQTPLCALRIVQLMHEAGVDEHALILLPGPSNELSHALLHNPFLKGVIFTGSTQSAQQINRELAARDGPIVPLIAETGGLNCMIVDSSALPEQVVKDAIISAFNSAGQRCSALRVLFVQHDIADRIINLLTGAIAELTLGDPEQFATDVSALIDGKSKTGALEHIRHLHSTARFICQAQIDESQRDNTFIAPVVFEIRSLDELSGEVFAPVLHIVRYSENELDKVIESINRCGYGLTLGIQTRINEKADNIIKRVRIGNIYVNRNMIGAVIGSQPFGGAGLSGTGPKAGGPNYLTRLMLEQTVSINTSAIGGNTQLLNI